MVTTDQVKQDLDSLLALVKAIQSLTPNSQIENTIVGLLSKVEGSDMALTLLAALVNMFEGAK